MSGDIPYPDYLQMSEGWADFFYSNETQEILLPILNALLGKTFYPAPENIFRCFYMTPLEKLKIVLLGQDPYHNGSATGLSFEVKLGCQINSSLQNIYKELEQENYQPTKDGLLINWATQGVLLLNTSLTVEPNQPESHLELWRPFFNHLMKFLVSQQNIVWLLLGRKAIDYESDIISNDSHIILKSTHPSGLSAHKNAGDIHSFFGSNVFKEANLWLKKFNYKQVVW